MTSRRVVQVLGPAYLDRVLLVDQPFHESDASPLDQSVDGTLRFAEGLTLIDPSGAKIVVLPPPGWPGPCGDVLLASRLIKSPMRTVAGLSWHDDLGGMGAGYAAALGGELVSALGPEDDPMSRAIADLLRSVGIAHQPIRVDRPADWTLLITSGRFGDKLPVGFRGCHAAIPSLHETMERTGPCDLRVVASFPNALAAEALRTPGAAVRMFAPAMRNMRDASCPIKTFADAIDILCCNRHEWETLEEREQVAWQVALLSITDGAKGGLIRFMTREGESCRVTVPAFPRTHPPRDTNRAGEAYASTLVSALLDFDWTPGGGTTRSQVERAGLRASAAAALVLDRARFGFPTPVEIDKALSDGVVDPEGLQSRLVPRMSDA